MDGTQGLMTIRQALCHLVPPEPQKNICDRRQNNLLETIFLTQTYF